MLTPSMRKTEHDTDDSILGPRRLRVFTSLIRRYAETVVRFRWIVPGLAGQILERYHEELEGSIKPKFTVAPRNRAPGEPVFPAAEGV